MKQLKPVVRELPDYVLAPWHRRMRWWLAGLVYRCWDSFGSDAGGSAEQSNPWWRR